jgi:hypothetical protein
MRSFISAGFCAAAMLAAGCTQATEEMEGAAGAAAEAASDAVTEAGTATSNAAESVAEAAGTAVESAKEGVQEGMAALTEKASAALAGIEGGPELLKKVTGFFDSAQEAVRGIKDTETAKAATAKLTELEGSIEGMSASMSKLPAEAKTALGGVIESGTAALKALVEKALAIPGVQDVIKPKLDEVMQKLAALSGRD